MRGWQEAPTLGRRVAGQDPVCPTAPAAARLGRGKPGAAFPALLPRARRAPGSERSCWGPAGPPMVRLSPGGSSNKGNGDKAEPCPACFSPRRGGGGLRGP